MRKTVGVLIIILVIVSAVFTMKNRMNTKVGEESVGTQGTEEVITEGKNLSALEVIGKVDKQLESKYPEKAEDLIELHNKLMDVGYKYSMNDEDVKQYVTTIRKMYSEKFKELNPEDGQVSLMIEDRKTMAGQEMELVASKITKIFVSKDDKDEAVNAEVNVLHATNKGSEERTYFLIKEEGMWKINGWETVKK